VLSSWLRVTPGFPSVSAAAAHARGVLDRDLAALERAGVDHRHPWAQGSAFEDISVVLVHGGEDKAAGAQLERALAVYKQAGANRDAARVRARLRHIGVRRRHWRHVERPVSGWNSLNDAEHRVAEVVAEDLTNAKVAETLVPFPSHRRLSPPPDLPQARHQLAGRVDPARP
jgi:hypothetical protein